MNYVMYLISLLAVIIVGLVSKQAEKITRKNIGKSLAVMVGAILLNQLAYYLVNYMMNSVKNYVIVIAVSLFIDVVVQIVVLFAVTLFYICIFKLSGKNHIWNYVVLVCCIIVSAVLYYIDYAEMYKTLANGIDNSSFLGMLTAFMPRFVAVRRIISILPVVCIIVDKARVSTKNNTEEG